MVRSDHFAAVLGSGLIAVAGLFGLAPASSEVSAPEAIEVAQALQTVRIGSLQPYGDPEGLVSTAFPSNWELSDLSDPDLLRYSAVDPFGNALFVVAAFESDTDFSPEQLGVFLQDDVESVFGERAGFEMSRDTIPQGDGSLRADFTFLEDRAERQDVPFLGNAFIEQRHGVIMLLYFTVPEEQFDSLQPLINEWLNTCAINPG